MCMTCLEIAKSVTVQFCLGKQNLGVGWSELWAGYVELSGVPFDALRLVAQRPTSLKPHRNSKHRVTLELPWRR